MYAAKWSSDYSTDYILWISSSKSVLKFYNLYYLPLSFVSLIQYCVNDIPIDQVLY